MERSYHSPPEGHHNHRLLPRGEHAVRQRRRLTLNSSAACSASGVLITSVWRISISRITPRIEREIFFHSSKSRPHRLEMISESQFESQQREFRATRRPFVSPYLLSLIFCPEETPAGTESITEPSIVANSTLLAKCCFPRCQFQRQRDIEVVDAAPLLEARTSTERRRSPAGPPIRDGRPLPVKPNLHPILGARRNLDG